MSQSEGDAWMPVPQNQEPEREPTAIAPGADGDNAFWTAYQHFNSYMYQISDRRSRDMFLLGRMDGMILLTMGYLAFVFLGPKLMKKREAFQMRSLMLVYNIFLVALSAWMCLSLLINSRISKYNFWCVPYKESYEPADLQIVNVLWWYYISKAIEFMDTVFMILKKKQEQVTFLHVYHHVAMFPIYYFTMMMAPCCQAVLCSALNSFIHVLMYSYYGLALFPALQKYLWWKRYLTQLQLLQFVIVIVTTSTGCLSGCDYPNVLQYVQLAFLLSLVVLFSNFYIRSYIQRSRHLQQQQHGHSNKHSTKSVRDAKKTDKKTD